MINRHDLKTLTKLYEQILQGGLFKHGEFEIFDSDSPAPIDYYLQIDASTTNFSKLNLYNARIGKTNYRLGEIKVIAPEFVLTKEMGYDVITLKSNKFLIEIIKEKTMVEQLQAVQEAARGE